MTRLRLDTFLVRNGYAASRARAQRLVAGGQVRLGNRVARKPGQQLDPGTRVEVDGTDFPYVSRGGLKLEAALASFDLDPFGVRALDIGASTGGFTDALLQHGAARVTTVDTGSNQLHPRLRRDARVTPYEGLDIRASSSEGLGGPFDWVLADISFLPLTAFLEPLRRFVGRLALVLIKPQFEVSRSQLGGGGVVRDRRLRQEAVRRAQQQSQAAGLCPRAILPVPVTGEEGNQEYFLWLEPSRSRGPGN